MDFKEAWFTAVEEKNSVLCAGLDPAEYEMRRGEKGIPSDVTKRNWALRFVEAVAPHAAALKPNIQYWKNDDGMEILEEITALARSKGIVVIDDSKLADIGSTNEAGIYHTREKGMHAVTIAPYAGNFAETAQFGRKHNVGLITMCLMSNPDYAREKLKLVPLTQEEVMQYDSSDVFHLPLENGDERLPHVHQYIYNATQARMLDGIDGIVIGAPSEKNHIHNAEIKQARKYAGDETLVLLPGVGAQGGEADAIWQHFDREKVIVNVGRSLMFPKDRDHTDQAAHYKNMLNELRK